MRTHPFIAVDWGTTNRRAYRVGPGGTIEARVEDRGGVLTLTPDEYPCAIAQLRRQLGEHSMLLAGMVGSTRGWFEVPYVSCSAGLADLAGAIRWIEGRQVGIVPGVSWFDGIACDVMRGEEVQALGAVAVDPARPSGMLCHPGTHTKWIQVSDSRIQAIRTVMTGELFALLRDSSILSEVLDTAVIAGPSFRAGIDYSLGQDDLTSELFRVRARVLLGRSARETAASYVSGMLIGYDLRAGLLPTQADEIAVIGRPDLSALFVTAVEHVGRAARCVDADRAFAAGMYRLMELAA